MKARVMDAYRELVRSGDLLSAWLILRFLNKKKITFGLNPSSAKAESVLDALGCRVIYSRNYSMATFLFPPEQKSKQ
ncbi:MAG: hypothetical protein IJG36_04460 [Synergistaceae bacterium]|nr:hypothetical protein [Synergistaceae bacterium]